MTTITTLAYPIRTAPAPAPPAPAPDPNPNPDPDPDRLPRTSTDRPWDRVRFVGPEPAPRRDDVHQGPVADLPDPAQWAGALVRSAVEALLGVRPPVQLARWLSAELYDALTRRAGLAVRVLGRPTTARRAQVRRVHVCRISERVAEASVVVHDGRRPRAAAVRLEVHRGRWRATALEIG